MWEIEVSREASNYAIDSLPYNEGVLIAIENLASRQDGLPTEGVYQTSENWCIWEIAEHTVVYERDDTTLSIDIWLIKPKP